MGSGTLWAVTDLDAVEHAVDAGLRVWVVIVGGGSGQRFGGPKQFADLEPGVRVIDRSVRTAHTVTRAFADGSGVVVVVPSTWCEAEASSMHALAQERPILVAAGGDTRSASVRAGLAAISAHLGARPESRSESPENSQDADVICVHDAARPLASVTLYRRVIAALGGPQPADAAVPGCPLTDTVKQIDHDGWVVATPDRASLIAVQTPQAFRAGPLRHAHRGAADGTDDAVLVEIDGGKVRAVEGEATNFKITQPDDIDRARELIAHGGVR